MTTVADSFFVPRGDGRWLATAHTLEAVASADGREVARATAWRVLRTGSAPVPSRLAPPPVLPDRPADPAPGGWVDGYLSAIEWRAARGSYREAAGEWICLDAQTVIATGGAGLATSVLSDLDGPVGVGAQSLLVAPRERGKPTR